MLKEPNDFGSPRLPSNIFRFAPVALGMCAVAGGIYFYAVESKPFAIAPIPSAEIPEEGVVGMSAAAVMLEPLAGRDVFSDHDLRNGTTKFVYFFASWSAQSLNDLSLLRILAEQQNVEIFGVAVKDQPAHVERLLADYDDLFSRIGMDRGKTRDEWRQSHVNVLYLIDGDGTILLQEFGLSQFAIQNRVIPALEANK